MNNFKYYLIIICLCIGAMPALGQKETPPPGGKPKDFVLPAKKVSQLKNGLKSTMVQYGSVPKVTVNLIVKTGNVNEGPNEVWLADLTGGLLNDSMACDCGLDFCTLSWRFKSLFRRSISEAGRDGFITTSAMILMSSGANSDSTDPDIEV